MADSKTYVKLKDTGSIFMIMEQGITVVGKKVEEVKKSPSVIKAVKHGILEYTKKPKAAPKKKTDEELAAEAAAKEAEEKEAAEEKAKAEAAAKIKADPAKGGSGANKGKKNA